MNYRNFASTSIKVSEIALGTMHFQWIISEKDSLKLLDHYFAAGGNFIDTADMYTQWGHGLKGGEAEAIIGKWFKLRKNRAKIFLTTKVRARVWEGKDGEGLSKVHIIRACNESLKRLQTDYIDLYMAHWSDSNTPIEETLLAYKELVQQGKVRFIGCSNYASDELKRALEKGKEVGINYICIEPYYNLISRNQFEKKILPLVKKYNLAVTPYSPLAGGFLSGIYRKNVALPKNARAKYVKEKMTNRNFALIDILNIISKNYGKTIAQVALAWLLRKSYITAPIIGPETIEQLKDNLSASGFILEREDIRKIDNLSRN